MRCFVLKINDSYLRAAQPVYKFISGFIQFNYNALLAREKSFAEYFKQKLCSPKYQSIIDRITINKYVPISDRSQMYDSMYKTLED